MNGGTTTVAFAPSAWDQLVKALEEDLERAWVLIARLVTAESSPDATLLVRSVVPVPDKAYVGRNPDGLSIASSGWVPAFGQANADDGVPIFVHTHPGGEPRPSKYDHEVDRELRTVAGVRTELGHYASLVFGGRADAPTFTGRVYLAEAEEPRPVDRVRVVGEHVRLLTAWSIDDSRPQVEIFDRQVRAFGGAGQRTLRNLKVGVVGAGGTGSVVIEQLARLGVGEIVVVDLDTLTETNVTRVYGSSVQDIDLAKVEVAAKHVRGIGLETKITPIEGSLLDKQVAMSLIHCDVIFGCTDDHAGRTILTRMPQSLLQLLIDCGVTIDSRDNVLHEIWGRVSVVTPASPCLVCMGEVDPAKSTAEQMTSEEYDQRANEGYAPELKTPDPSVVTYTTATAAFAVNEALSRLLGYADPEPANRLLLRMANRKIGASRRPRQGNHRCGSPDLIAMGVHEPYLNWGWR